MRPKDSSGLKRGLWNLLMCIINPAIMGAGLANTFGLNLSVAMFTFLYGLVCGAFFWRLEPDHDL